MISAYLYSTERTGYAIVLNICRALVLNTAIITGLPALLGSGVIWYTYGISEGSVLIVAFVLLRLSERKGIVFKEPTY